ncbi:MAG: hypothetical protein COA78_19815 [Blastopirellula sp.]|nr:MAG: hypothetical protein COA78_19815 [Blastopirellula sp.]
MATDAGISSIQPGSSPASQGEATRAIQKKLKQTRLRVKLTELVSGLIVFATVSLLYLLTLSVIDHWVIGLGFWARLLSLVVYLGTGSYFVWHRILPLLMNSINPVYVAKIIEQGQPSLKNSLINFLLLRKEDAKIHQAVMSLVEEKAADDLSHIPLDTAVDYSKSIHLGYVLAGVAVVFGLYAILSPKDPMQTAIRVAMPWADLARPSRVEIVEVTPGDATIYQGNTVEVIAKVYDIGDDPVMLYYSTLDQQLVDQPVQLTTDEIGTSYRGTISPDDFGIQQELIYRIEAGDAVTRDYRIQVREAPAIEIESIQYKFPLYTGEPNETQEREGNIRAVEGTRVFITAKTNGPINKVHLQFDPDGDPETLLARRLTFDVSEEDPQQAKVSFFLKLKEDQKTPKYRSYLLLYENQEGVKNPNPVRYSIDVLADLSPEIEIISPEQVESEVPLDGSLEFELRAIDPDYALSQITINGVSGETKLIEHDLLKTNQSGQQLLRWDFQPAKHKLKAGQTVHIWAVAEDNKTDTNNIATPNQARTQRYAVRILPPVKQPENNPDNNPEGDPDKKQQNEPNEDADEPQQNENKPDNKQPMPKDNQQDDKQQDNKENPENKDPMEKQEPGKEEEPGKPNQENQQQPEQGKQEDQGNQDQEQKENSTQGTEPSENKEQQNNKPEEGDNPEDSGSQSEDPGNEPEQGTQQEAEGGGSNKENEDEQSKESQSGQGEGSGGKSKPSTGSNPGSESGTGDMNNNQAADQTDTGQPNNNGGETTEKSGEGSRGDPTGEQQFSDEPVSADGSQDGDAFDRIQEYLEQKKKQQQESGSEEKPEEDQLRDSAEAAKEHSATGENDMGEKSETNNKGNSTGVKEDEGAGGTGEESNNKPNKDEQQGNGDSQDRQGEDPGGDPMKGGRVQDDKDPSQANEEPKSGDQGTADNTNSGAGKEAAEDNTGSPPSTDDEANRQKKNNTRPDGKEEKEDTDQPKAPSESKEQSEDQSDQSGDQSGAGGPGGGQSAKQEGNDSAGSTSAADEGKGKAEQKGMGETGKEKGTQDKSDGKTGSSGTEKGNGSATQSGDAQTGKGTQPKQPQDPKDEQNKDPSKENSDAQGSGAGGSNDNPQGGGEPNTLPNGTKPPGPDAVGDKANLEYTRKATDMVLDELKNQKNPDQKMLDELGWTKEELQQFTDRWNQMKSEAANNQTGQQAKQELDDALRSLGLSEGKDKLRKSNNRPATAGGAGDSSRSRPPAAFLEQYKAYLKGASQRSR